MPQGVVIFAGNNARKKGWAYRNSIGKLVGYLVTDSEGGPLGIGIKGDPTKKQYTAVAFTGVKIEIVGAAKLPRSGSEVAYPTGGGAGKVAKEDMRDAAGQLVMRCDSTGMFEVVAKKLQKLYSLPKGLVKEFSNVHDDFAEGGTKADSRKNFLKALKEAPGPGGASDLDFFAYSGHGSPSELPSAGINRSHIATLAAEIKRLVRADGTVILYACSTGKPNGFAQQLSGQLLGMTVWGHLPPPGPASINPRKVKYKGGLPERFVEDFTEAEFAKWKAYVIGNPDFYARYPFLTLDQMIDEVGLSLPTTAAPISQTAAQAPADAKKRGWNPLRGFKPAAVH